MFYDPNQAFDNRSLRNAAPHIYKRAAEICAGEDEREEGQETCCKCGYSYPEGGLDSGGLCLNCAAEERDEE